MIIPIRCLTCGKPIGHLWEKYKAEIAKDKKPKDVLDELGLERMCCRMLFTSHVDLLPIVAKFKR